MATSQFTAQALALPLADRIDLMDALWQSLGEDLRSVDDAEAIALAVRRDDEVASGAVIGRSHEDVMQNARRALRCD